MHSWLAVFRRYALFVAVSNLVWEALQIPLYTIWSEGSEGEIAFSVVHCTGGDVVIALGCLTAALIAFGVGGWPEKGFTRVTVAAIALGTTASG